MIFLGEDRGRREKRNFPSGRTGIPLGHRAMTEKSLIEMVVPWPGQEEGCAHQGRAARASAAQSPSASAEPLMMGVNVTRPTAAQPRGTNPYIFSGRNRSAAPEERREKTFPCKHVCSATTTERDFKIHVGFASQGPDAARRGGS